MNLRFKRSKNFGCDGHRATILSVSQLLSVKITLQVQPLLKNICPKTLGYNLSCENNAQQEVSQLTLDFVFQIVQIANNLDYFDGFYYS